MSEEVVWLEPEEREKFVRYCTQEAVTSKGMVEQMRKLGDHTKPVQDQLLREAAAFSLVAMNLDGMEEMTIG